MADDLEIRRMVLSYQTLRILIGYLGMALPLVLWLGGRLLFKVGLQPSISEYYFTGMRGVFVGILVALGTFLFAYQGPEGRRSRDDWAGNLAGLCAALVAFFPCLTEALPCACCHPIPNRATAAIHYVSAALFFLTLAYFCFKLFTLGDDSSPKKALRNRYYRACGWTILGALAGCAVTKVLKGNLGEAPLAGFLAVRPVFFLESLAVWAFGLSWLIKGDHLPGLRDA